MEGKLEGQFRWLDLFNLLLGLWLFVSPFFGFGAATSLAAFNAYAFGIVIMVLSGIALFTSQAWEEWVNMAIAIWLMFSPLALGYFGMHMVMLNHVDVGLTLFIVSLMGAVVRPLRPFHERHVERHTH